VAKVLQQLANFSINFCRL